MRHTDTDTLNEASQGNRCDPPTEFPDTRQRIDHQKRVLNLFLGTLKPHRQSYVLCQMREELLANPDKPICSMPLIPTTSTDRGDNHQAEPSKMMAVIDSIATDRRNTGIVLGLSTLAALAVITLNLPALQAGTAATYSLLGLSIAGFLSVLALTLYHRSNTLAKRLQIAHQVTAPVPESAHFTLLAIDELLKERAPSR
ncbi:hypothetical protein [Marinobacter sp. ELB17]|uniref:hypothetical protein n=1 Tax=Marinobacter sp. ELB17 TaxID=270374 RepID=UPI0000F3B392|nr:hypothetical protein [Marinobacter sp. ELB17]EAZ98394.1 hypothetical protein MELB17_09213 [Marinobacter sp. ELB17]